MVASLPIDPLLPDVVACLRGESRLVLRAPPGAGKTTRVPAALLDAGLAGDKQVLVLEPRRIAARAAAEFVAAERGGVVGEGVGYRVRFEQRGGPATRLWFVTEGVLGRQLVRDPFLEAVGIVVLDEFHERHLHGDVALAVVCELQESVRPDLKLVVMSATLETGRLASTLGGCPVLTSEGRAYAVRIEYAGNDAGRPLSGRVARALEGVLESDDDGGDVLVFLPGAAEIRRCAAAVDALAAARHLAVVPLHGDLALEAQQRAIRRGPQRKVVLSTNVAETALTIEGITTVIDSGLAREARLDRRHGINALQVVRISRAAADQRAGRAGRTAPGRCVRLWAQAEHGHRREYETPEVLRLDLSGTVLELRAWGMREVGSLRWLDAPAAPAVQQAEALLRTLGAIDASGAVTAIGRRMLALAVPPRLARILVEAERRGCAEAGALLAALASERDICLEQRALGGEGCGATSAPQSKPGPATPRGGVPNLRRSAAPSDLLLRIELFEAVQRQHFDRAACASLGLDHRSVRAVEQARRQLYRVVGGGAVRREAREDELLRCVLAGFPDRVARRRARGSPRAVMVGGTGVVLAESSVVCDAELFVAVEVDAGPRRTVSEARVRIASGVRREWLAEMCPAAVRTDSELVFDDERQRVVERRCKRFADLILEEEVRVEVDAERAGEVLAAVVRRDPEGAAAVGDAERAWLTRVQCLARWMPEIGLPPDPGQLLAEVIVSLCAGCRSLAELRQADLSGALRRRLTGPQRAALEREAPAQYRLPTGRLASITYAADKPPCVAARIQEVFGLTATPRLASGRVPLVFQLLAPNQRPMQITDDLAGFWQRTYPEVRKILRGRYPKHPWPEDPLTAPPTARAKAKAGRG